MTDEYAYPRETPYAQHGMTLRDWFAGQAINAALKKNLEDDEVLSARNISYDAYLIADAMMEARKK